MIVGVNKYQLDDEDADRDPRDRQHRGARGADRAAERRCKASATRQGRRGGARRADRRGAHRARATCSTLAIEAVRARATVGEISRRAREGLGPPSRRDAKACPASTAPPSRRTTGWDDAARPRSTAFADGGRPPAAHDDRQARPGRPRPRREGGRHRVRRPRLRRRHRAAVPDAGGSARARRSRTTCTRSASRRWPPATRRWCRRLIEALRKQGADDIIVVRRRRDPAAGLRVPERRPASRPSSARARRSRRPRARCSSRSARRGSPPARCDAGGAARASAARPARPCRPQACRRRARATSRARSPRRSRCSSRRARDHQARAGKLLDALLPHTGQRVPPRHHRRARRRQVHLHRGARPAPDRHAAIASRCSRSIRRARVSGGSILGDKTRMERLSRARRTPSSGPVAVERHARRRGREDARGDAGVRGGRLRRRDRRDGRRRPARDRGRRHDRLFVLLQLPNAGDDLQAIKKGVIGAGRPGRRSTRPTSTGGRRDSRAGADRERAVACCGRTQRRTGTPPVLQLSALKGEGIDAFWRECERFRDAQTRERRACDARRQRQALAWMWRRHRRRPAAPPSAQHAAVREAAAGRR